MPTFIITKTGNTGVHDICLINQQVYSKCLFCIRHCSGAENTKSPTSRSLYLLREGEQQVNK